MHRFLDFTAYWVVRGTPTSVLEALLACLAEDNEFHGAHMALPVSESVPLQGLLCRGEACHWKICVLYKTVPIKMFALRKWKAILTM